MNRGQQINGSLTKSAYPAVLPVWGVYPVLSQIGLVLLTVLLPAIAHLSGAPVRWLVPMHWAVILAGLVFGWRGGLIVGMSAPLVNYLITGFPLPLVLPAMSVELTVYGGLTGLLREKFEFPPFLAVVLGLIAGRIVFLLVVFAGGAQKGVFLAYAYAAMLPGLLAAVVQIATLPVIAQRWIQRSQNSVDR